MVIPGFVNGQYWSGLINNSQQIKFILNFNCCMSSQLAFQKPVTGGIKQIANILCLSGVTITIADRGPHLLCEAKNLLLAKLKALTE